jgi:hypothetical protein
MAYQAKPKHAVKCFCGFQLRRKQSILGLFIEKRNSFESERSKGLITLHEENFVKIDSAARLISLRGAREIPVIG